MKLDEFQINFLHSIKNPTSKQLVKSINPAGSLDAEGSVQVYRKDYLARLSEAMGEHYESIWFVLGDEDFFDLVRKYIISHPSSVRDLGSYGQDFSKFLSQQECIQDFPFISKLAEFECKFWKLFHSRSVETFDAFAEISPENLASSRWHFPQLAYLFQWDWDVPAIFAARENVADDMDIDWEKPSFCLLIKLNHNVRIINLTSNQFSVLKAIDAGETIEQSLCGEAAEIQALFGLLRTEAIPLLKREEGAL